MVAPARRALEVPPRRTSRPSAGRVGRTCRRRRWLDDVDGARQLDPARASATIRTTRTCRCRSTDRRRGFPIATRLVCTGGRSRSRAAGVSARSCCTSAAPTACTPCTSTGGSPATAPTAGWRASTTSRRISSPAATTWRSSSCVTARTATWRTRTSGGWRGSTVRSHSSVAAATHVTVAGLRRRVPRRRTASARSRSRPRSAGRTRRRRAGRCARPSRHSEAAGWRRR